MGSLKNPTFRGAHEKPIWRGDCLKMGLWTVCRFKGVFLRGWGGMGGFILKGVLFGKNDLNIPVFFLKFVTNSFSWNEDGESEYFLV